MIKAIAWNAGLVLLGITLGRATFEPHEPCEPSIPCETVDDIAQEIHFLSDEAWYRNQRLIKELEIESNNRHGI